MSKLYYNFVGSLRLNLEKELDNYRMVGKTTTYITDNTELLSHMGLLIITYLSSRRMIEISKQKF